MMLIPKVQFGNTCESFSIMDCEVIKAPPKRLLAKEKYKRTYQLVVDIVKEPS